MRQSIPLALCPVIVKNGDTNDVIVNPRGNTDIRLTRVFRDNPVHWYWQFTITHHGEVRAQATSLGRLPHAIFHAIQACVVIGLIGPPDYGTPHWIGDKYWHVRENQFTENRLSCHCAQPCHRHRPLLTVTTMTNKRIASCCMGEVFSTNDEIALVRFVAEQLIAYRYLR